MWDCGERRVQGGGQRLIVSLYNKVWFGTGVWEEGGHDILQSHRVKGSVWSVVSG